MNIIKNELLFDLASDLRAKFKYMPVYRIKGDDLFEITITGKKELVFLIWPRDEFILSLEEMKLTLEKAVCFYKKELKVAEEYEKIFPEDEGKYIDI